MQSPVAPAVATSPLRIERVGMEAIDVLRALNRVIFQEERLINTLERQDLVLLLAYVEGTPCAFKMGYRRSLRTFYSAKGGVLPAYRRRGIAELLNEVMIGHAKALGCTAYGFDTFPNRHPGMSMLAMRDGYRLVKADYIDFMSDYRLSFIKQIA